MTENQFAAFRGFSHPMEVVDRTEMPYERRLAVLQDWQATLASTSATDERGKTILGAIRRPGNGRGGPGRQTGRVARWLRLRSREQCRRLGRVLNVLQTTAA